MGHTWMIKLTVLAILWTYGDSQDIAESTLSRFEGEEAQLICPEADTSTKPFIYGYDWYKDRFTGTQGSEIRPDITSLVALYQAIGGFVDGPYYRNDLLAAGRATLDTDDASLTIHQLQLSDDSWYGCEVINQYGNIRLNVNVHPSQPSISVSGAIIEGTAATLTCTVDRIKPNTAIITWGIRGSSSPSSRGNTVEELLDSTTNVYKLVDTWSHQFTRDDHNKEVECNIIPQIVQSPSKTTRYTLNVLYTYQTSVIKSDSNRNPVRGQAFSLRCNSVTGGNPATVSNYKWSKDGSDLAGEASSQLTFDPVTEADNGEYKCYIRNSVGWTLDERTAAYNLQVWYVPSITSHPQGQTLPAGGSVTFTCTADYFPDQQVSTQWLKADTDIPGETGATYTISQVKKTDRGDYKCKFCNVVGCTESNEATLSVLYGPEGIPESSVGAEVHKTGDTVRFDCDISSLTDQGNPAVTWIEWTHNVITKQKGSDTKYEFTASSVLESGEYRCRAGNSYGESSYSQQTTLTIEAPVKIEFPEPGEGEVTETFQLGTEQNSEVKMSCTASGSDIDHISWHRNDVLVSDGDFDVASSDVTGQYSYDQTSGKMSELRWKHGDSPSCEEAGRLDGTYYCTAYGDAAAAPGTDQSVNFNIQLQYPAIWNGDTLMQTAASLGDKNVQIKCPVCANPPPSKYVWIVNGTSVKGNITEDDDTITIDTVQDSDFTSYKCKVENNMDGGLKSSTFKIELIEKGQPRQPREFTVVTGKVTSSVIGLQWMAGFDGGYPPLSYELQYNILGESNIMVLPQEEFDQHEGTYSVLLHPLQSNTVYEIQVRSRNSRPAQEGGNASPWASLQYSTYESPEISVTIVDVKVDQLTVNWDYEGRRKRELSNLAVTVQILYRESGSGDYTQDPTKTPATQRQQKVQGQFSTSLKYDVKLRVYEGDIPLASQDTKEYTTQIKMKEAFPIGLTVGVVLGTILFAVVLAFGYVLYKKGRLPCGQHQLRKHDNVTGPEYVNTGMIEVTSSQPNTHIPTQLDEDDPVAVQNNSEYMQLSVERFHCDPSAIGIKEPVCKERYATWYNAAALKLPPIPENDSVLVKSIKDSPGLYDIAIMKEEIKALKKIPSHANILNMLGFCFFTDNKPFIVFESPALGPMNEFLQQMKEKKEKEERVYANELTSLEFSTEENLKRRAHFAIDIITGLNYIHTNKMLHPALDCSQVWITSSLVCKLTGFITENDAKDRIEHEIHQISPSDKRYAPETRRNVQLTSQSNVWSFGTILWQIFSLVSPPRDGHSSELDIPDGCPDDVYSVMTRCWQMIPKSRPTTEGLIAELTEFSSRSNLTNSRTYEEFAFEHN